VWLFFVEELVWWLNLLVQLVVLAVDDPLLLVIVMFELLVVFEWPLKVLNGFIAPTTSFPFILLDVTGVDMLASVKPERELRNKESSKLFMLSLPLLSKFTLLTVRLLEYHLDKNQLINRNNLKKN
jgi:hypothetical protein